MDLRLKGPTFSWSQARSYDSHISGVATQLGGKWLSNSGDMKLVSDEVGDDPVARLVVNASSQRVFEYWEELEESGYYSPAGSSFVLEVDQENSELILTSHLNDEVWIFYDFYGSHGGMLKERTTRQWRDEDRDGTVYTYNVDDTVSQITSPEGQDYNIVFTYNGDDNITEIEVRTGAGTSTRIKEVEYTYFDSENHSSDLGAAGDLVQVKTARLKSGGDPDTAADWIVRYTQYRYNSEGMLKAVLLRSAVQRIIDDRSDISAAGDILTKADDDDNSGAEDYKIKEYASRRFTYYTVDVKTDNSGAGTQQDPKCTTVWAPSAGENLQTTYGGTNVDETAGGKYLVKSEIIGACSSCGGSVAGITREYFYLDIDHGTPDSNEVTRLVVEDTIDGDGNGVSRKVYGLSDSGRKLRRVLITDPTGSPQFWCKSWKLVEHTGAKLNRLEEYRTPAAHNVTSSTVDEFLDPSDDGDFTNDTNTLFSGDGVIYVYEYNDDGYRTGRRVKQGRTGSAYYVLATDYYDNGEYDYRKHLVTYRHKYPEETTSRTAASRITTAYAYTFWSDTDNVKTITTTLPSIPSTQNGSGSSATAVRYYDELGRFRWRKDPLGYVTYYSYHPKNGAMAYVVSDADPTSLPTSADANSTKWVTSSDGSADDNKPTRGGGLPTAIERVAFREFDGQGRRELSATEDGTDGTVLSRHYTVYGADRTLRFPYWDTSTNKPLLPIRVRETDDAGRTIETYTVDPARTASSGGKPTGLSAGTDQGHYLSWARYDRDDLTGKPTKTHVYHDIPSSGYGTKDTNYAETVFGYDVMGRRDRVVSPGGTVTRIVYDDLGRAESTWVGTDDVPSSGDWSPTNNSGANMTKVVQYEYDEDGSGGNGNITKIIRYLTDDVEANARVTELKYDGRSRQVFTVDAQEYDGKVTYTRLELDNLGRTTKTERYYDADDDEDFPTDGTVDAGDRLLARTEPLLDKLGRVYRTKTYAVDPDDGTVGSCLVADIWYDAAGRVIKGQSARSEGFTKTAYDGLGRVTKAYRGYDTDETAYGDADDVTGDTVLEQTETDYDASFNVIQTTGYARKHTASGTGALGTSTARVTYVAAWYDDARRRTAVADYGTNGGSALSRPSTAPASSDTVLVTTTEYNTAGRAYKTTDPAGREDRREFDDAGRLTKTVQNYTDGNPSTGGADEDVTVERTYNSDGNVLTLTAKNPTTGDQVTRYVYGTDVGGITPEIYRNDLLRAEIYPDSDDTTSLGNGSDGVYDRVELEYNIAGDRIEMKDQLGTVHEYDYDRLGRRTHDRVTTVASGVDDAVRRISTSYDIRGLTEKVTSYDNPTVGSGSALNEVVFEYDDSGNPTKEHQEHEGAKDGSTLYVQYNYDTSSSGGEYTKGLRPTSVRYPNARLVHYTYGTSGSTADAMGRVDAINADDSGSPGDSLAEYTCLGRDQIVKVDYPEPDLRFDLDHGTAGEYAGLDRFGRVVDLFWRDYGSSSDAVRIEHGYDRASNRLYREDPVADANNVDLDELYTYDEMYQLVNLDRGDLNANKDAISGTPAWEEDWSLDMTGNWTDYIQKTAGSTDLDQDRTHDNANEITEIDSSSTHVAHDKAGNMTKTPKPDNWSAHFDLTYDAWNRLMKVEDGQDTVAEYEYDGRNFRTVKKTYDAGQLDETRHFYYNTGWQCLEERLESGGQISSDPDRQFVWGQRYIDALIVRDRDTDANGTLDERLYALQDPNWNVVALAETDGDVAERYAYNAYGKPTVLTAAFASRATSSYAWETRYAGYRWDPEVQWYRVRHRNLLSHLGRWDRRDPIGYTGGAFSLYTYVRNNALGRADPFGLQDAASPADTDCSCGELPPPKTITWRPQVLSGQPNIGLMGISFSCTCPYRRVDEHCLEPSISYYSVWQPVIGTQTPNLDLTDWAEYYYCVCSYSDGVRNVFLADEWFIMIA